jgi:glycosyltransferase involved in cell wall biosynthesis
VKKIDIGIDTRMIDCTGIGTYTQGLLSGLQHLDLKNLALFGPEISDLEVLRNFQRINFTAPIYSLSEQFQYPQHIKRCKVWHATHYNVPFYKPRGIKLVATVHDLIHWVFRKEYFGRLHNLYAKTMFNAVVKNCDHIIAVSEHTKKDLIRFFNAKPDRVTVISEAVSDQFKILDADSTLLKKKLHPLALPEDFFIFVGSLKPHKNLDWLLSIFEQLHEQKKMTTPLIIVGRADAKYPSTLHKINALEKKGVVKHYSDISNKDLVILYNLATALIHPSQYEGFGLTILEAMACGTPVICCPNASIPEVAGEAAWMVDSGSEHGMMQAILSLNNDLNLRAKLRKKGLERVKFFSWDKTALETQKIYELLLN